MKIGLRLLAVLAGCPLFLQAQEEIENGGKNINTAPGNLVWDVHDDPANAAKLSALPPGTSLLSDFPEKLVSATTDSQIEGSIELVNGQPFDRCVRLQTSPRAGAEGRTVRLKVVNEAPVRNKDMGLITFWARGKPAAGTFLRMQIVVQMLDGAREGSLLREFSVGEAWEEFYFPFRFKIKGESEPAVVQPGKEGLWFGLLDTVGQSVEIADVQWTDFQAAVKFSQMPITSLSYAGREPDAPWRKAALDRIEKYRKADLTVNVQDAAGRPVSGAEVEVREKRSAFPFGTAVRSKLLVEATGPDAERYREELAKNFGRAVFEGEMKWVSWNKPESRIITFKAADWLRDHGLELRGHVLVYPKWRKNQPGLRQQFSQDPEGLRKAIDGYIADMAGAFKGEITDWDVINEHTADDDWTAMLGSPAMIEWFKKAHAVDPGAKLVFNDNSIAISPGGTVDSPRQKLYYQTVKYLKESGAPIDGMGLQYRAFSHRLSPPERVLDVFEILNGLGPDIYITEFDLIVEDEQLQADLLRDYMTIAFSQPKVKSFLMWGFWDGAHHQNNAPLFREDWSLKPSGQVFMDLLFHQWWTSEAGRTNSSGVFSTRGFLGDYTITATYDGKTAASIGTLEKGGLQVILSP
ncbi:hypothetical protein BH09VER1_BH09VER1_07460 [soil metagenome]